MKIYRIAAAAAVGLGMALAPPAQASPSITTVASGLDNPRGLDFAADGDLYVAEAGTGGTAPCMTSPEGDQACWGTTGAVTKVHHGHSSRVLTGLPSIAGSDGSSAIGPSDVSTARGGVYFTVGLGADPSSRAQLPRLGQNANGWLLTSKAAHHDWRQVADVSGYEAAANPDGVTPPDSNPQAVLAEARDEVVADAGGNDLLRVDHHGHVSTLAVFPERMVPAPPFLGLPDGTMIPAQAVPTSVVRGPDGAYYVGQLTGFPFAPSTARVFRVVPGHTPTVAADGFTDVIDVAFDSHRQMYVLEISHGGLLGDDTRGALIRVGHDGSQHVLLHDELTMPGGLTIHDDAAYISNCSVCAGGGSVLRMPLS